MVEVAALDKQSTLGGNIIIYEVREDAALKLIADKDYIFPRDNPHIAYVMFGGDHAFGGTESFSPQYNSDGRPMVKDNIAQYNAYHNDSFSLIEIVPASYYESSERIEIAQLEGRLRYLQDILEQQGYGGITLDIPTEDFEPMVWP
ncbi:MAG: hypothetical protein ABH864_06185 [archaeon]